MSLARTFQLATEDGVSMKTLRDVLDAKGRNVWSISPDAPVFEAIQLMAEKSVGALLAMDGESLVGIISERDYARKVILAGRSSKDTPVRAIMTAKVICCPLGTTTEECMAVMTDRKIRHVPVIEDGKVAGMVSIGDLVKTIIAEQRFLIDELVRYVSG